MRVPRARPDWIPKWIPAAVVGVATIYPALELSRLILFFTANAWYPEHPGYAPLWVYWAELVLIWGGWTVATLVAWRQR